MTSNHTGIVVKQIQKAIPTVVKPCQEKTRELLLMQDDCDSHRLINVLETPPEDLCCITNEALEQMTEEKLIPSTNVSNNIRLVVGQMTILIYQSTIIEMEKSLWTIYFNSGTANIWKNNQSTLTQWPTCLKSMIQNANSGSTISDCKSTEFNRRVYFNFVVEHLRQLNEQEKQIQEQLSAKKNEFRQSTNRIEEIVQTCVQKSTEFLRLQYQYKMQLVELNYHQSVLENELRQGNFNEQHKQHTQHLIQRKCDYEIAKHEIILIKHLMARNQVSKSIDSVSIALPSLVHWIDDRNVRDHLQDRHCQVMKHYKNEMMKLFLEASETKRQESQLLFDIEFAKLRQDQRLNPTMIQFMESQLALISRKFDCIYNYKVLQQQQQQ